MKPSLWFITYDGLPDLDPDDGLAAAELRKRGFTCAPKVWDDPRVDWSECQFGVVRSTWDYHRKYEAFDKWLSKPELAGRIWNPPEIIRWNSKKTYLRELENSGIAVVPTIWIDRGTSTEIIRELFQGSTWTDAIMKPVVGLSTYGVTRLNLQDLSASVAKASELIDKHDVMLQPYVNAVGTTGEHSLMFMRGQFSHAIRKVSFQHFAPAGGAGERAIQPDADELEAAHAALNTLQRDLLYARVDLVRDDEGKPCLMELELVEPSLFLQFDPKAAARFADAIEQKVSEVAAAWS